MKDNTDDAITAAVAVIDETFTPAVTIDDSARRYTSSQVSQAIFDLTGVNVTNDVVYAALSDAGYKYVVDETSTTIKYVWLLKYRV